MTIEMIDVAVRECQQNTGAYAEIMDAAMRSREYLSMMHAAVLPIYAKPDIYSMATAVAMGFIAGVRCGRAEAEAKALEGML